jgi:hypothetical protein
MSKKLLLPGWDSLSPKKQVLVKNWVESVLQAQEASKALIELCNCDDVADGSTVTLAHDLTNKEVEKETFEILESQDNSEKFMELAELPDNLIACIDKAACLLRCGFLSNRNERDNCRNDCNSRPDCKF